MVHFCSLELSVNIFCSLLWFFETSHVATMLGCNVFSASYWCAEVDCGRLRVVSKEWHYTFEFTPEVILRRFEQADAECSAKCQAECRALERG